MKFSIVILSFFFLQHSAEGVLGVPRFLQQPQQKSNAAATKVKKAVSSGIQAFLGKKPKVAAFVIPSRTGVAAADRLLFDALNVLKGSVLPCGLLLRSFAKQWQEMATLPLLVTLYGSLIPVEFFEEIILESVQLTEIHKELLTEGLENLQLIVRLVLSIFVVDMGTRAVWDVQAALPMAGAVGPLLHTVMAFLTSYKQTVLAIYVATRISKLQQAAVNGYCSTRCNTATQRRRIRQASAAVSESLVTATTLTVLAVLQQNLNVVLSPRITVGIVIAAWVCQAIMRNFFTNRTDKNPNLIDAAYLQSFLKTNGDNDTTLSCSDDTTHTTVVASAVSKLALFSQKVQQKISLAYLAAKLIAEDSVVAFDDAKLEGEACPEELQEEDADSMIDETKTDEEATTEEMDTGSDDPLLDVSVQTHYFEKPVSLMQSISRAFYSVIGAKSPRTGVMST